MTIEETVVLLSTPEGIEQLRKLIKRDIELDIPRRINEEAEGVLMRLGLGKEFPGDRGRE
jgi:hypothetical protein